MAVICSSAGAEGPSAAVSSASVDSTTDLAPTSSVPWNPPRAASNHEPWEQVLNAPLTLVSLPIRALGALTEAGLLRVQQDRFVPRVQYGIAVTRRSGLNLGPPELGIRPGFGVALTYVPPPSRGWLRASVAGSFHRYHRERVELGPPWLFADYTNDWRPQEPFYGIGADAGKRDVSNYAMRAERAELQLRLRAGTRVRREVGAWLGGRQTVLRSGRDPIRPSFETAFPPLADALDVEQRQVTAGTGVALDTRSGRPHWARGWRLEAQAERVAPARWGKALFSDHGDSPGFRRFTLAGQVGWSFMRDPRTLRLAARVVDIKPFDPMRPPAPFDLSHLGAGAGLAGFEPGRFHGLDLLLVKLDYIFPLVEYAELQLSTEVGAVSGDVWHETRVDRLERSYSVMLRPRSHRAPLGAFGVSWSREETRVSVSLGGVE
jgi:hypothetical protein